MSNIIEVVPYDSKWAECFVDQAFSIRKALGTNCVTIHHIGSTAVPGLAAKPIIDMIPVVLDITGVDKVTHHMEKLGFEAKGEHGMLFRRYFQKDGFSVHVFEDVNPVIKRHLLFRDWMRTHSDDKYAYAKLKKDLALQYSNDVLSYNLAKNSFISTIDKKTGFNGFYIVKALTPWEWEAARCFRQKYYFNRVSTADPYTWTFKHKDHLHFILYQGYKIVGYAHIQLGLALRAVLRVMIIDEPYRNNGMGGAFLHRCERWLKQNGMKILHIQALSNNYAFYCKYNYVKMPFSDLEGYVSDPQDISMGKVL